MTIKQLLQEANAVQVGIAARDWQQVIAMAARPLVEGGYIQASYPQAVIENTLTHGAYYVFEEGIAIPHARPETGVIRDCFSMVLLAEPVSFDGSDKADIVIMFGARDSNAHIEEGIRAIVTLLEDEETLVRLRQASSVAEVMEIL
ncbi:PTS fructose transporter subunit IIA [Pantoea ananatis]|jgi:PTS system ascorbate-specific IIA component|uniref:Ascorbate-specific PTS system EIIA component n=1 Tax=Pantoea ananas TaxID=553 RepID=A0AAJ1CZI2_PANAN|nr:PTS sugar transporter subunit IIA [Pantoea ananatis]AWQ18846.1 PTS fructose transporter subunit IIA [Pantoea ananatis]KGL52017.1 PTS fructose transporter subunit IIA [Pantoea ananatis]KTR49694.1 PTS fructose transporter subunit IIA [Pantoea ananatis]KTR57500.1 PTS fructose transporter subunit IIA [Pantoea ananatis]KTR65838.1 PTS fructose transporter subunit IIA [Pantoea ananatis]